MPKIGYKVDIRLENPIRDIGSAIKSTRNIDFLYLILKDLFNVLLISYLLVLISFIFIPAHLMVSLHSIVPSIL